MNFLQDLAGHPGYGWVILQTQSNSTDYPESSKMGSSQELGLLQVLECRQGWLRELKSEREALTGHLGLTGKCGANSSNHVPISSMRQISESLLHMLLNLICLQFTFSDKVQFPTICCALFSVLGIQ